VQCNNWNKFGKLFQYADSVDAEFVATGHYARLEEVGREKALLRGRDSGKDQSYVLYGVERKYLKRMID
jgi:tRNA-specific 2-thiouridylase